MNFDEFFWGVVRCVISNKRLNFGDDPDTDAGE